MQNKPIDEIRFLKFLVGKLSDQITKANRNLSNEQLNGLFHDTDKLMDRLTVIEQKAIELEKLNGNTTTV